MNKISFKKFDELLDILDIEPILNDRKRQVRWLYKNSNKCTHVYDEKMVRLIVHRLQDRIQTLKRDLNNQRTNNYKL